MPQQETYAQSVTMGVYGCEKMPVINEKLSKIHATICASNGTIGIMLIKRTLYPRQLRAIIARLETSLKSLKEIERDACDDRS